MILKKTTEFFEKNHISIINKKICLCFSGGADSVALLTVMEDLQKEIPFSLCAVHVNHHIRGEEANRDENFCISLCKEKNIPLFVRHVDVPAEAKANKEGLEETARKLRYKAFETLMEEEGIDYFLTAHHKNDLAETVTFNFLRGCGVSGLVGIPSVRGCYLRPFLSCSKDEILSYLSKKNQDFVEDGTNNQVEYTRNYIRHSLFPMFERVNEGFLSALTRLSESAKQDESFFDLVLQDVNENTDLSLLHPSVSSRYICRKYEKLSEGEGLSHVHVKQILSLLSSKEEKSVDVPFGITAFVREGRVIFKKKTSKKENEKILLSMGENTFGEKAIIILKEEYKNLPKNEKIRLVTVLDRDKIKGGLYCRAREDGDCIFCLGMNRKISKELINRKISKHNRDYIPVICDDEGIVFAPFIGASDRVFAKSEVENPLLVETHFHEDVYSDFSSD